MSILTLIGSIGLLLYALQLMSEGLQKIAGDRLRHVQSAMTRNRVLGVLTGLGVTAMTQSSGATTVMAVSFANAGLLTLMQAMAVIMGANIGTTVTTWIIASLGYGLQAALLALPLIALALPFFNSRKSTNNSWGELLLGVGLLLISLTAMQSATDDLQQSALASWLTEVSRLGVGSVWIGLAAGMVLTAVLQTSSATFTLVLVICAAGWINLDMAFALLLGANIGTCIPPMVAARTGNAMARRAAMSHLLFNMTGAVWVLCLFPYTCQAVLSCCLGLGLGDASATTSGIAIALALWHTLFNLANTCLLLPLARPLSNLVTRMVSEKPADDESFKLQYLDNGLMQASGEMALVQVQREVARYAGETYKMFTAVNQMLAEPMGSERQLELMNRVKQMENASDKAELEIAQFLNQLAPQTLSMSGEQLCRNLYKIVDELESIADALNNCSVSLYQKSEHLCRFNATMNANITRMMTLTEAALSHMAHVLTLENVPANALNKAYNHEDEINNFRNQMRNQMLVAIERREVEYQQYTYFMLLVNECEKIGDHVINVIAAASL